MGNTDIQADIYVFAYGSNMDLDGLTRWMTTHGYDPDQISVIGPGHLPEHMMVWRNVDGYADAAHAGPGSDLPGVILAVTPAGLAALDHKEGHPTDYKRVARAVFVDGGPMITAWMYQTTKARRTPTPPLPPAGYMTSIVRAAIHWNLPVSYIEQLRGIQTR